jgi:uncharacterized protein
MKRLIYQRLLEWKNDTTKKPLLVRGARQIGKTFIVNEFGKNEFKSFISLNFERNPEYKEIFTSNSPIELIERITLFTGKKIQAGKTLLFLDEIQECPQAIVAFRYFFEEMPELHIIGAGSLLEFALHAKNFRMPVGRVQYLFMYPMCFGEFLDALGEEILHNYIKDIKNLSSLPEALHEKLNSYVRKYFSLGGMPAVVNEYIKSGDLLKCFKLQRSIIDTYIDDFAKYAGRTNQNLMRKIIETVPVLTGQKFVYTKVDNQVKSTELRIAFELLEMAGVVYSIFKTTGDGIPLEANANQNYFKPLFLDIGLMHAISNIYLDTTKENDLTAIYKGTVAEQFTGQELLVHLGADVKSRLYYWAREERNSHAELDFLIQNKNKIIPIEVKSGSTGRLKSLQLFMEKYKTDVGYKISQSPYQNTLPVISLPFYAIEAFLKDETI